MIALNEKLLFTSLLIKLFLAFSRLEFPVLVVSFSMEGTTPESIVSDMFEELR